MVIWAVLWSGIAGVGVLGVVLAAAEIQGASTDDAYFRGSARLWACVGAVVAAMSVALSPSVLDMGGYPRSAQEVVLTGTMLPAVVAVGACWYNAWALVRVRRRRTDALQHGHEFEAIVVERERKPFAHDMLSVTLEASLPTGGSPGHSGGYRTEARSGVRTLRLVETCPGDQWARLVPGRHVRVRLDPSDVGRYALVS